MGMQIIGDKLVESLKRMVGDVEEDGAVALFAAAADQFQRLFVALQQGGSRLATKG